MPIIHGGTIIEGSSPRTRRASVALGVATGAGGLLAWQNPEDVAIIVTGIILDITTPATGVATADFGAAASAATSSDTLLDGVDIGTAAGVFDNFENQGTNGKASVRVAENGGAADFVTGSASADPAGLVGRAHISYILSND